MRKPSVLGIVVGVLTASTVILTFVFWNDWALRAIFLGATAVLVPLLLLLIISPPLDTREAKTRYGIVAIVSAVTGLAIVGGSAALVGLYQFHGGTKECPNVTDPRTQRDSVINCANTRLTFSEDEHGAADVQFLDIKDIRGVAVPGGPLAAIIPESNIHHNVHGDLGSGRIVAKIWVDSLPRGGYPKLGLGPGWNYVWIDSGTVADTLNHVNRDRDPPRDSLARPTGGPRYGLSMRGRRDLYRAVIVPENPNFPIVVRDVDYYEDKRRVYNHAFARWTFWPNDTEGWINCTKYGCCAVTGENN